MEEGGGGEGGGDEESDIPSSFFRNASISESLGPEESSEPSSSFDARSGGANGTVLTLLGFNFKFIVGTKGSTIVTQSKNNTALKMQSVVSEARRREIIGIVALTFVGRSLKSGKRKARLRKRSERLFIALE